jgi:hypothetical protein
MILTADEKDQLKALVYSQDLKGVTEFMEAKVDGKKPVQVPAPGAAHNTGAKPVTTPAPPKPAIPPPATVPATGKP